MNPKWSLFRRLYNAMLFTALAISTVLIGVRSADAVPTASGTLAKWQPYDFAFTSPQTPTATISTVMSATFSGPGGVQVTVPAFYSGSNTWIVRFCPTVEGAWSYVTTSATDAALDGKIGTFTGTPKAANARGFLKIDPVSPYHFAWDNGEKHFKLGYEVNWLGQMTQDSLPGSVANVNQLLDTIVNNGFTDVLLSSYTDVVPSTWLGASSPLSNGPYDFGPTKQMPWMGASKSSPQFGTVNTSYWKNFDSVLDAMLDRGLIAHMYLRGQSNKYVSGGMPNGGSAAETDYIKYVVARYQAYPNVIFDYQKEANTISQAAHLAVLAVVQSVDGYANRLRTAHDADLIVDKVNALPKYHYRTDQFHSGANPFGGDTTYQSYDNYNSVLYQRNNMKVGGWPVYIAERVYQKPNSGTGNYSNGVSPETMIDQALEIVMAGGYFAHYYELHAWDLVKYDEIPNGLSTFGNLARFMKTTRWSQLAPSDALIVGGGAAGKHLLAKEGSEYIALTGRSTASITFSVNNVSAGTSLTAKWVNLVTGAEYNLTNVVNGAGQVFSKPSAFSGAPAMLYLSSGGAAPTNQAPVVNAGTNISVSGLTVSLSGAATDTDGPGPLASSWSLVSGPGTVSFGNAASTSTTATFSLAGVYVLRLSATDGLANSSATVQVTVGGTPPPVGGDGLKGEYFANKTFTSTASLTRTDTQVNFNWGTGAPAAGLPADGFSIRWTGFVTAPVSGTYTFYVLSNDGNRLWVDGTQLTNRWTDGISEQSGSIALTVGQRYPLTLEMYENINSAQAVLSWAYTGQAKQVIPQARLSSQ